ncbi:hypothetical protein CROQUDRAFT_41445 [Cronartium quercuum f. sp. fusiforme G11]|uniref:Uncharacterized protein n=1 Tax=Cronartium quercuum f. sp. fusiforme G11 TaxID=708437 RepID=A0A9P6NQI5_9BASI|nr:hypothetical protein CROQUDRAFT_41445 [Cronartium quercuum f. sp. fusiforme G11]
MLSFKVFRTGFDGIEYHLISCGFWAYHHYCSEVVRTVKGICGIWKRDECENDGVACLVSPDPTKIGGPKPQTSWLFYSRAPTLAEQAIIESGVKNLETQHGITREQFPYVCCTQDMSGMEEQIAEATVVASDHKPTKLFQLSNPDGPQLESQPDTKLN